MKILLKGEVEIIGYEWKMATKRRNIGYEWKNGGKK